jgi:hypothetical protein
MYNSNSGMNSNEPTSMQTPSGADQFASAGVPTATRRRTSTPWLAALLATVATLIIWKIVSATPYIDADAFHYRAMAAGQVAMKPFAFRVLLPAMARLFANITGNSTDAGFLVVGLLSLWTLLYGTLLLVLERGRNLWLVIALISLPFWQDSFRDYWLPDLLHAALVMLYLLLLRKRRWGWSAAMLVPMYLARESTLLIVLIAVPVLWWLAGRRAGLLQALGALAGMAASKFAARHALPNQHNIDDTLYMIGKIPWNAAKNIFGVILWSNTLQVQPPIRTWNIPHWLPLGGVHQVGYSAFDGSYPIGTAISIFGAFGLGTCVAICLAWKTPLRQLLPREDPYLCIAGIYGASTFLLSPLLGAALLRLFAYGWPLFLVYLPAMVPRVWRNWPVWAVWVLLALHIFVAWINTLRYLYFHNNFHYEFALLLLSNLAAAWLLLTMSSRTNSPGNSTGRANA